MWFESWRENRKKKREERIRSKYGFLMQEVVNSYSKQNSDIQKSIEDILHEIKNSYKEVQFSMEKQLEELSNELRLIKELVISANGECQNNTEAIRSQVNEINVLSEHIENGVIERINECEIRMDEAIALLKIISINELIDEVSLPTSVDE